MPQGAARAAALVLYGLVVLVMRRVEAAGAPAEVAPRPSARAPARPAAARAAALAVYAVLVLSAFTRVYDPLPELPRALVVLLLAAPHVAFGLAFAAAWAPLVPLALALPHALASGRPNALAHDLSPLAVAILAAAAAVLVACGMLVRTAARPGLARLATGTGIVVLALSTVPLLWAGFRDLRPRDESPARPLVVDDRAGLFEVVRLGDAPADVRTALGRGRSSPLEPVAPLGEDVDDVRGPSFIGTPGETHLTMRYPGVVFLVSDGRVYGFLVTADDAETGRGAGVGDNLAVVRREYPRLDCGTAALADGSTFPYCAGDIAPRRHVWFGGDPIRSITVASVSLRADQPAMR